MLVRTAMYSYSGSATSSDSVQPPSLSSTPPGYVAARHMRQLRPGIGRASPVILGKRNFFSENEIKFVSPYMSVIITR